MGRQGGREHAVIWRDLKDSLGWREDKFLPAGWMVRLVYEDGGRIRLYMRDKKTETILALTGMIFEMLLLNA